MSPIFFHITREQLSDAKDAENKYGEKRIEIFFQLSFFVLFSFCAPFHILVNHDRLEAVKAGRMPAKEDNNDVGNATLHPKPKKCCDKATHLSLERIAP